MKKKVQADATSSQRRKALEEDVEKFLQAGNQIQYIKNGVSAQDPQSKGRPLSISRAKGKPPK